MVSVAQSRAAPPFPLLVGGGLAAIGFLTGVVVDDGPVLCLFRRCTGGYCPGCGGSRAVRSLARGDLSEAWAHHPWTVLLALQFVIVSLATTVVPVNAIASMLRPIIWFNATIAVAIWAVRLSVGAIPMPLS